MLTFIFCKKSNTIYLSRCCMVLFGLCSDFAVSSYHNVFVMTLVGILVGC